MESYEYPNPDPGPYTVLTGVNATENIKKTKTILEKAPKGTVIMGEYGSRFITSQDDLEPVLREIKNHDRVFIDPNRMLNSHVQKTCKALDMTCHQIDMLLPLSADSTQRDEFFKKIIQNARENGTIVVSMPAVPAFLDHLLEWTDILEKNCIKLVTIDNLKTPELLPRTPGKQ